MALASHHSLHEILFRESPEGIILISVNKYYATYANFQSICALYYIGKNTIIP